MWRAGWGVACGNRAVGDSKKCKKFLQNELAIPILVVRAIGPVITGVKTMPNVTIPESFTFKLPNESTYELPAAAVVDHIATIIESDVWRRAYNRAGSATEKTCKAYGVTKASELTPDQQSAIIAEALDKMKDGKYAFGGGGGATVGPFEMEVRSLLVTAFMAVGRNKTNAEKAAVADGRWVDLAASRGVKKADVSRVAGELKEACSAEARKRLESGPAF